MSNEVVLRVRNDHIQIEHMQDGVVSQKPVSLRAIQEVLTRDKRIETPLMPCGWGMQKYVAVNDREMYVFSTPPHMREVTYNLRGEEVDRQDKFTIPMPGFVWIIITRHRPGSDRREYHHGHVYAVRNPIMTENDEVFRFPFSNVDSRWMCWGDHSVTLGGPKSIGAIPDRFLSMKFNHHLDENKFEPFQAEVKGQKVQLFRTLHLFRHLDEEAKKAKKEGKEPEFKWEILKRERTIGDAIAINMREHLGI